MDNRQTLVRFTVYLPNRPERGAIISPFDFHSAYDAALKALRAISGGYTKMYGQGTWLDTERIARHDDVSIVTVLAPYQGGAARSAVEATLEAYKRDAQQDAVLYTVESVEAVTL